ncbi:Hexameric tyrosine-coordinated heme protein (HTHP) [Desulfonatronum thiosulfatophilum]|uniref:Hexameric tyrosine-coordinated heme protein (HTHP) n=1 Tax=Desulfonatronum thiosulfatophilum TaxID=617002 RepID=A0A1G6E3Z1_9BACT|nr:hexameric tyrosine-coordinated heme protein [Desulfonatronum thiosulfatophilum]SDB52133.1 Hexameric tyrosine-coordinated heme protein (HTHP) [Desulfonatronum thiosulfatophilum]
MRSITSLISVLLLISLATTSMLNAEQEVREEIPGGLSLITATPEEGFQLALALARKGVTETQRDKEVLKQLRPAYAHDPDSLIAASHVVAVHFQTIAAANNYWRDNE